MSLYKYYWDTYLQNNLERLQKNKVSVAKNYKQKTIFQIMLLSTCMIQCIILHFDIH